MELIVGILIALFISLISQGGAAVFELIFSSWEIWLTIIITCIFFVK